MPSGYGFKEKLVYCGAARVALDAIGRLGLRPTPYHLMVEEFTGPNILPLQAAPGGLVVRFLSHPDLAAMADIPGRSVSETHLQRRLDAGMLCLGALSHNQVVAFNWVNLSWCSSRLCRFALRTGEAYLFDVFTHPAYRGRGIAPHLRFATYIGLAERGIHRLYSISEILNPPSLRVSRKVHARILRTGLFISLGRRWQINLTLCSSSEGHPCQAPA